MAACAILTASILLALLAVFALTVAAIVARMAFEVMFDEKEDWSRPMCASATRPPGGEMTPERMARGPGKEGW